jgi:haloalkane dehalogenase
MPAVELKRTDGIAYREALPDDPSGKHPILCVHGFPETSYLGQRLLEDLASGGYRGLAPDLPGCGDSPPDPPGTWEHHMESVEAFWRAQTAEPVTLVVHDWGGLIGLRWACEHPDAVAGLVISNTGFFPEGKWHGFAEVLRTEGAGEEAVAQLNRDGLAAMLRSLGSGFDDRAIDEYWKSYTTEEGRQGPLDMYRSGDFEKLEPYRGRLAQLNVPTLILWGEDDQFAPVAGAYRFRKEIPQAELVIVEGARHFVYEDEPERCAREVLGFLSENGL